MNAHNKLRNWSSWLALATLICLLSIVTYTFYFRLTLSLGPRVILQPWALQLGYLTYENMIDQHSPLMPALLSFFRPLIPDGLRLAKIALVALLNLTAALVFCAGKRTHGWLTGLVSALFLVIWLPVFVAGKLWHETFLAPLYVLLFMLYDPYASRWCTKSLIAAGVIGGVSILVKQQAVVVFSGFILWCALTQWHARSPIVRIVRDSAIIGIVATLPICLYLAFHYAQAGTLENLAYWTVTFNVSTDFRFLAAQAPTLDQVRVVATALLLIPLAILLLFDLKKKGDDGWLRIGCALVLLATSSLTAYPRFGYFHLLPILPTLAWLSAATVTSTLPQLSLNSAAHLRSLFVAGSIIASIFFSLMTAQPSYANALTSSAPRKIWEYSDLDPLAQEIRQHIGPGDCFFIFPDDEATANLYYLTQCLPPKFWSFSYPWYMLPWTREKLIMTLEDDPPLWVVHFPGRWKIDDYAPDIMNYIQRNYQRSAELQWAQGTALLLIRNR
jgi:hypothetical protein